MPTTPSRVFLLAPQFLGAFGVAPDVRFFELPDDFDQACLFGVEVKDTSAFPLARTPRSARLLARALIFSASIIGFFVRIAQLYSGTCASPWHPPGIFRA